MFEQLLKYLLGNWGVDLAYWNFVEIYSRQKSCSMKINHLVGRFLPVGYLFSFFAGALEVVSDVANRFEEKLKKSVCGLLLFIALTDLCLRHMVANGLCHCPYNQSHLAAH